MDQREGIFPGLNLCLDPPEIAPISARKQVLAPGLAQKLVALQPGNDRARNKTMKAILRSLSILPTLAFAQTQLVPYTDTWFPPEHSADLACAQATLSYQPLRVISSLQATNFGRGVTIVNDLGLVY